MTATQNFDIEASCRQPTNCLAEVTAVVLAGGLGTRLRPVLADRPKVLAEIHGRPFLKYLLDQLIGVGIGNVVLCTGYLSHQVREVIGDCYRDLEIAYSAESTPLGTGGALRLALPKLQSDPVLVLNGDSYCAASLELFWAFHRARRAAATLLVAQNCDADRFGQVTLGTGHEVIRFREKGTTSEPRLINAGMYLIQRSLISEIPLGLQISLEREVFPSWIGRGFFGCATDAKFLDIGTPESYAAAEAFFEH